MTPTNPIKRKNRKQKMADYTISSGDTFKDLVFPNPDEELARIKLASKVNRLIADQGLTQKDGSEFLGISRSKMTSPRNDRLGQFSINLLFSLLEPVLKVI